MEGLANEKLALEQMLASEKQALAHEKQDLADQLRMALSQLQDTQGLLRREQDVKLQLEQELETAEIEKTEIANNLQDRSEELSCLKNELLKFQAQFEKDKLLIESLQNRNTEQEQLIYRLQNEVDEASSYRQQWDVEREELAK